MKTTESIYTSYRQWCASIGVEPAAFPRWLEFTSTMGRGPSCADSPRRGVKCDRREASQVPNPAATTKNGALQSDIGAPRSVCEPRVSPISTDDQSLTI